MWQNRRFTVEQILQGESNKGKDILERGEDSVIVLLPWLLTGRKRFNGSLRRYSIDRCKERKWADSQYRPVVIDL